MLGKPQEAVNLIICHLGAGSSMCAVQVSEERCGAGQAGWADREGNAGQGPGRLRGSAGAEEGGAWGGRRGGLVTAGNICLPTVHALRHPFGTNGVKSDAHFYRGEPLRVNRAACRPCLPV